MLTACDLFSNIGSHAIGFDRAGIRTVAFCESDQFRREVLARHFPGIPIHDDVRSFDGCEADILIGGPPCQETSVIAAVQRKRTSGTLWPEQLRIGLNMAVEWIVVEQPIGNALWEAEVADDLCDAGYHCARLEFSACDVGAPYPRRRLFVLACTALARLALARREIPSAIARVARAADARGDWSADKLAALRVDAGSAGEMDRASAAIRRQRIEALGDSNPPHMAEVIGQAIIAACSAPAGTQ
jgi:DNA (cytosine-5)-methyltransferase 1